MLNQMLKLFACVCFILFSGYNAKAETYYVDKSHPNTSDSNFGNSESLPFKTLDKALQIVVAGDTVFVKNGTYYATRTTDERFAGAFVQANPGKISNRITIKVYPGHTVTLKYDPSETNQGPLIACKDYTTWDGFKIVETAPNYKADTGPVVVTTAGCNLLNLDIQGDYVCRQAATDSCDTQKCPSGCENRQDNHSGIRSEYASNLLIQNTKVHGFYESHSAGGFKDYGSDGIIIENCEFYGVNFGVNFKDSTANGIVRYSYFHDLPVGVNTVGNGNIRGPINVYQNVFRNLSNKIIAGGGNSSFVFNVYNNTIYSSSPSYKGTVWGHTTGINRSFWNNIVKDFGRKITAEWYDPTIITYWDRNGYYSSEGWVIFQNTMGLSSWCSDMKSDCNSGEKDPLFVDEKTGDFRLKSTSPFVSTGKYPGIDRQDYDHDGNTSENINMGAYITGNEVIGVGGTNYTPQEKSPKGVSNLNIQ